MNSVLILFVFIIILGLFLGIGNDPYGKKRKLYTIIIISLLILESSLRSVSIGVDTKTYYYEFLNMKSIPWSDIWQAFRSAYIEGETKDPGFLLYIKLFQSVSGNFNLFLFVSALFFFVPLGIILYRYSTHILQLVFAFTLYIFLFHVIALSGIRQQISTGFTFMAFLQLGKDKYWKSILLIGIGALIHISAMIFLVVVFLKFFFKNSIKTIHAFSFATIPFGILYASTIMFFFASFLVNDYYSQYAEMDSTGGVILYIVLMELLSLFCFISIKRKTIIGNSNVRLLYIMMPLLTMTVPLISLNGSMIRVGQYFTLYMMLLVPIAIDNIVKYSERVSVYSIFIILLFILNMGTQSINYLFFWQE